MRPTRAAILVTSLLILAASVGLVLLLANSIGAASGHVVGKEHPPDSTHTSLRHRIDAVQWHPSAQNAPQAAAHDGAAANAAARASLQTSLLPHAATHATRGLSAPYDRPAVESSTPQSSREARAAEPLRALVADAVARTHAAAQRNAAASVTEKLPSCPMPAIALQPGYHCEAPHSPVVRLHVLVTLLDRSGYRELRHLGMVGLSNADVFVYLRSEPNYTKAAKIDLPCGMRLHERLLLPNLGEEGAVFATHVAAVYDDMPDAIIALHGGKLTSWHARCSVAIRRMRAFYRGLGNGPTATPAMKAFASTVVTLNSLVTKGRAWSVNDCCGPLMSKVAVKPAVDYTQCPWERVGQSRILYEDVWPQPLCQLRDRTPDTNWTVVAYDVPEFFIRQREILAKYESDPLRRVPITHLPPDAATATTSLKPAPTADGAAAPRRAIPAQYAGATSEARAKAVGAARALSAHDVSADELQNFKDSILPEHRQRGLFFGPDPANRNDEIYGLEKMWVWMLKVHGIYDAYMKPPTAEQRVAAWCCFQFAVPGHVLKKAPKAWWLDLAYFATHLGWKERSAWPNSIGIMFEYRLWASLGHRFLTAESVAAYVDIDREMGEDALLGRCKADLDSPLCA